MDEVVSLAELRRYQSWTPELEAMASRAAALGVLSAAHERALDRWFESTQSSSLSSCTAVVIGNTQAWRDENGVDHIPANDAAFTYLLLEELRKAVRPS